MLGVRSRVIGGWFIAAGLLGTAVVGACADKKGALMLAINTDMRAPKDVNAVSVTISTNGAIKHSFIGRVTPQGEVLLPATLAIVEPEDTSASIRIRVMAFQNHKPRVLRDVRTTIPVEGRTAVLRIPLNFVNDASAVGPNLPNGIVPDPIPGTGDPAGTSGGTSGASGTPGTSGASGAGGGASGASGGASGGAEPPLVSAGDFDFFGAFQPPCPDIQNQTIIDGECKDNFVDSSTLPDFVPEEIGNSTDVGSCFNLAMCFANALGVGDGTGEQVRGDAGPALPADAGTGSDTCPAGQTMCQGGACADLSSDPKNCGICGRVCADPKCIEGQCAPNFKFKDFRPSAVTLDKASCQVVLNGANPDRLNLALVTPDTGECVRPGECFVPIDRGPNGWTESNGRVQLPTYICKLINGKNLRLATSIETCAAKEEKNPICASKPGENLTPPVVTDGGEEGGIPLTPGVNIPEDFATSVSLFGDTIIFASQSRIATLGLANPAALPVAINGITPGTKLPYRISSGPDGIAIATGGTTNYVLTGLGPATTPVTVAPETIDVAPGKTGFFWAAGGQNGGVFITPPNQQATKAEVPNGNMSAIAPTKTEGVVVVGDTSGSIQVCHPVAANCGSITSVDARVDALVLNGDMTGFALATNGIYAIAVDGQLNAQTVPVRQVALPGIQDGPNYYAHGLAVFGQCLVYSTPAGLELTRIGKAGDTLLVATTPDRPILGVAIGPSMGGAAGAIRNVFYTVFAPRAAATGGPAPSGMTTGGGIFSVALPADCAGSVTPPLDAGSDGSAGNDGGGDAGPPCDIGNCASGCCGPGGCVMFGAQDDFTCGNNAQQCLNCNGMGAACNTLTGVCMGL